MRPPPGAAVQDGPDEREHRHFLDAQPVDPALEVGREMAAVAFPELGDLPVISGDPAAAVQGAIFSVVKTVIDRQGARMFEKWTGEWPGS